MLIKALMDNVASSEAFDYEHGFCLYIETQTHKILFDTGASALFIENARKMEVDLSLVDLVFISHGHYDHGGGIRAFLEKNNRAKIYMHKKAPGFYYSGRSNGEKRYIGLEGDLFPNTRFVMVENDIMIDENLMLYTGVKEKSFSLPAQGLYMKEGASYVPDDFSHEQNLIIQEGDRSVLLAGCAHRGIVNILERFYELQGRWPTHVIGGFHLYNLATRETVPAPVIEQIGRFIQTVPAQYYTGHCTGTTAYLQLKEQLQDRIAYLASGSSLEI